MKDTLRPGVSLTEEWTVTPEMSPPHLDVAVLATPWMLGLVEQTSLDAIRAYLEDFETIVGTGMTIKHLAVAHAGEVVTVTSTLTGVGRRLTFDGIITGERGPIGTVALESAVIDKRRFARSVAALPPDD